VYAEDQLAAAGLHPAVLAHPSWLAQGSQGADVAKLQRALAALGYDPGPVDGVFGPRTLSAVMEFQRRSGLAADGVVGPRTRAALDRALSG